MFDVLGSCASRYSSIYRHPDSALPNALAFACGVGGYALALAIQACSAVAIFPTFCAQLALRALLILPAGTTLLAVSFHGTARDREIHDRD